MNIIEKFYSDAKKLLRPDEKDQFSENVVELFCKAVHTSDRRADTLAQDISSFWLRDHANKDHTPEQAIDWFYDVFSLLSDSFSSDMKFSSDDWSELKMIVSSSAEDLDLNLLNSILTVIVEQHQF